MGPGFTSVMASASTSVSLSFSDGDTLHLLLTLSVLLVAVHAIGFLFVKLRQPRVAGEIIAGLALGPTLLGLLRPDLLISSSPGRVNDGGVGGNLPARAVAPDVLRGGNPESHRRRGKGGRRR